MAEVLPFATSLTKRCTRCRETKPDTLEFFYKQRAGRRGKSSECRDCKKARMVPINKRHYEKNREAILLRAYAGTDEKAGRATNVTPEWMRENVTGKPCHYCGTEDAPRGCDRLDNDIGHVIGNVVPCCKLCNKTRNNHFSPAEMRAIGRVIAQIRQDRRNA